MSEQKWINQIKLVRRVWMQYGLNSNECGSALNGLFEMLHKHEEAQGTPATPSDLGISVGDSIKTKDKLG